MKFAKARAVVPSCAVATAALFFTVCAVTPADAFSLFNKHKAAPAPSDAAPASTAPSSEAPVATAPASSAASTTTPAAAPAVIQTTPVSNAKPAKPRKKRKGEVEPYVEPTLQVGPPVLASYVINSAGAYAAYVQSATGINEQFMDGPAVAGALKLGVHSEQHQMQQGVVAYAAVIALQDPTFVASVRKFAALASQRDAVAGYILRDPYYVMTFDGHDTAAALIYSTLNAQGLRLQNMGERVRKASYDVQLKGPWSKKNVPDPAGRLEDAKMLSSTPLTAPDDIRAELQQASIGAAPLAALTPPPAPAPVATAPAADQSAQDAAALLSTPPQRMGPYPQAIARGMAIAALAVLGKAGDDHMDYVMPLLINDGDGFCFSMSKLNLYQCLSVARPYYEDIYCLGLHAVGDTGRCVLSSIGSKEGIAILPKTPEATQTKAAETGSTKPVRRRRR